VQQPARPDDELDRLKALRSTGLLDSAPEARFDRLTRLIRRLLGVPVALVSLVDDDRQWFKSAGDFGSEEMPRDSSFCGHAILGDELFYVRDAREDSRFRDNPHVACDPYIRFYASCPLHSVDGYKIGTLCVIDYEPRELAAEQVQDLRDVAAIVQREIQASEIAVTDQVTGLPNRRGFMVLAGHALEICGRNGLPACLVFIDLDDFKRINDAHGHNAGDEALRAFARCLQADVRATDVCARYGGDEFAVLLTGHAGRNAEGFIERLKAAVEQADDTRWSDQTLLWSYGAAPFDSGRHPSIEALIDEADRLMYQHKAEQREDVG
jgi:diguanylate cyclase (GGDEF)-like protein